MKVHKSTNIATTSTVKHRQTISVEKMTHTALQTFIHMTFIKLYVLMTTNTQVHQLTFK